VIYRCNHKYNGEKCQTPHVTEDEVKAAFVLAYNQLLTEKNEIIANTELIRKTLCMTDALEEEKQKLEDEMTVLVEMTQSIVAENARIAQNQDEYQKRYNGLVERYDSVKAQYDKVTETLAAKEAQSERLLNFIRVLKSQDGTISEFDSSLWGSMVEFTTVGRSKKITVTFRDGTEIQA
jgi:chromosome segregation ATPase